MASIQIQIQANAKNAIENLKATQSNINNVGDSLVKLEGKLDPTHLNEAFESYNKLIDRSAKAMHNAGDAADYYAARQKVLKGAIDSVALVKDFDNAKVTGWLNNQSDSNYLNMMANSAQNAVPAIQSMGSSFQTVSEQVSKAEKSVGGFGAKFASTVKNILVFRTVMGITNNVLNKMKETLKDSIQAAAEAEQIYSKLNTVFGDYSDSMNTAIVLSQKIGVSASTAASALSTVGDLLQAQGATTTDSLKMATEWVEQFNDIIAFKDIDMSLEEFAQNFMSGAAGNLRNFRTFGSIVKESAVQSRLAADGLDKLTGSSLELAKMTARAEMALEQQKNAIGATSREWDTLLSIQRRYDEAWKQWKEDFGEDIARDLSKVKSGFTGLLTEVNKINAARKQIEAGEANVGVWDIKGKIEDWAEFSEAVADYANNYGQLIMVIKEFDATYEDVVNAITEQGVDMKDSIIAENFEKLRQEAEEIQKERDFQKWLKDTGSELTNLAQKTDDFVDSLGSLVGVSMSSNWEDFLSRVNIANNAENLRGLISGDALASVQLAIGQMGKANKETYSDVMGVLFGDDADRDAYEAWMNDIKSLYEILYNRMLTVGDVTEDDLAKVLDLWNGAKGELEEYNEGLERQKTLLSQIEKINGTASSYAGQLSDSKRISELLAGGMGEDRAKAIVAQENLYNSALASATTQDEIKAVEDSNRAALIAIAAWFDDVERLASEKEAKEKESARRSAYVEAWNSLTGSASDLRFQTSLIGKSDRDIQVAEAAKAFQDMLKGMKLSTDEYKDLLAAQNEYLDALDKNITALEEQARHEENMQSLAGIGSNMLGGSGVGQLVNTAVSTPGDGWVKALAVLSDVMMQTEEWADLMEQLNTLMEPILETGSYLVKLLSDHILQYMDALNVAIKSIGSAIVIVSAVLEGFYTTIKDGFQKMIGSVVGGVIDGINWLIGWINSTFGWMGVSIGTVGKAGWIDQWQHIDYNADMLKIIDEAKTAIEGIWEDTDSIDENTKGDFKTYQDLYARGMLSDKDYFSLIKGTQYASTISSGGVQYAERGDTRYITVNSLVVEGGSFSSMADLIDDAEKHLNGSAAITYRPQR